MEKRERQTYRVEGIMSEKRFTIDYPSLGVFDNETQKTYKINPIFEEEDLIDLLNNLHQENQQLKHYKLYEDNKRLQTIIADLKEENEHYKNSEYGNLVTAIVKTCNDLEKEDIYGLNICKRITEYERELNER